MKFKKQYKVKFADGVFSLNFTNKSRDDFIPTRNWQMARKTIRHETSGLSSSTCASAKFKTLWRTKFAVLMARERGRIGSDAALGDMPKRLQAHSYDEMNEGPAR